VFHFSFQTYQNLDKFLEIMFCLLICINYLYIDRKGHFKNPKITFLRLMSRILFSRAYIT